MEDNLAQNQRRIAVIDLGSNTFHLLIVTVNEDGTFATEYRSRVFVGLSDGGIEKIKEEKITFGLQTLVHFKEKLTYYGSPKLRVTGTAVLRKASNRSIFITQAEEILHTSIEIIDGIQEADYIYKGIMLTPKLRIGSHLIMDIGGGSTEFILVVDGQKIWSQSYILGVGVLHHLFHHSEPISGGEIEIMKNHVVATIQDLIQIVSTHKIDALIGASGSFEVLQSMTSRNIDDEITVIGLQEFDAVYEKIITVDLAEREKLQGMPVERAKLIVVGIALKKIILDLFHPNYIIVSPYALKEGILSEMM